MRIFALLLQPLDGFQIKLEVKNEEKENKHLNADITAVKEELESDPEDENTFEAEMFSEIDRGDGLSIVESGVSSSLVVFGCSYVADQCPVLVPGKHISTHLQSRSGGGLHSRGSS